jgi:hypothetical protein
MGRDALDAALAASLANLERLEETKAAAARVLEFLAVARWSGLRARAWRVVERSLRSSWSAGMTPTKC